MEDAEHPLFSFMPYLIIDRKHDSFTLHGRSRDARYTKAADWDYIKECAAVANPIPIFFDFQELKC